MRIMGKFFWEVLEGMIGKILSIPYSKNIGSKNFGELQQFTKFFHRFSLVP